MRKNEANEVADEFARAMRQMCQHQLRVVIIGLSVMVVVYTGIFAACLALLDA